MAVCLGAAAHAAGPVVRLVRFDAEINGATAKRIVDAIDEADRDRDALVLVEIDTPGGDAGVTEDVVKKILAAKTPVALWVGPSGAHAASGGFYLLIAADVAAMAPGTRTGAAAVVYGMGKSEEGDILLKKATNDFAALARSIAEHRGRNVESSEKAVISAESFTDAQALSSGMIDLVVKDRAALLAALDGRAVKRFDGTVVTLQLKDAQVTETAQSSRDKAEERIGGFLSNPSVVFLLFLIGTAGLYAEFNHPGSWVPGIVGGVAIVLFIVASQNLPVSTLGIMLVLVGLVSFILELKIASHGILAVVGTIAIVGGSLLLFPTSSHGLRPPLALVLPGSLTLAGICLFATRLAVKARQSPLTTGVEGLKGEIGIVQQALDPEGTVFVHGELWKAASAAGPLPAGAHVRVVRVRDLIVDVEGIDPRG